MQKLSSPRVSIVGAGPGDPELLTLKAARRIAEAEILFYDALANPQILDMAADSCRKVEVGKRGGQNSTPQLLIHEQLIRAALQGLRVVRLKGGDPFLFGRGGEECLALRAADIDYEIIPGITSGMAAAAYAGVPLTHRHRSQSVLFLTGHEARGGKAPDWSRYAQAADTLVIYMGIERVAGICAALMAAGLAAETPCLAVQWATLEQKQVRAPLAQLRTEIVRAKLGSPAILIIGAVVDLADLCAWLPRTEEAARHLLQQP
ncbi:uroporphyrinogen-III C-methyltransferase [Acidithiobacillus sp.]|jgi:uroporphyrin-III C-methyltransferase|uniref:uroporphyrinogen-III C-methyltransferase n=1 Tax=Acidithiobacillus sp. TaxID=1872118 RepID=UPI0025BB2720|nr:uroporphyrinogen-III C-methyltransferase [Acidithiobacillus sp.]MCK9189445.1 uroporphyrinogen-III C-methyltransferase [Acidithiobacillus sp.]MCK9358990.1 uroporphyrinogen-III C-methyltransferase [Acidithiobacillus sp.]